MLYTIIGQRTAALNPRPDRGRRELMEFFAVLRVITIFSVMRIKGISAIFKGEMMAYIVLGAIGLVIYLVTALI